jgi:hypothetical protein
MWIAKRAKKRFYFNVLKKEKKQIIKRAEKLYIKMVYKHERAVVHV